MAAHPPHRTSIPQPVARALPLWMLYPVFFAGVYLSHITLLRLPYFWDEGGYYIPAAWDFFRTGTLIPVTTATNAHPPLPSILLASWWHLSGFVPSGTRTFICMVAAAGLLAVFRLARNLLGPPAAVATTLLTALYPVWFAQSTLAHADTFAAAFTLWALSFYLHADAALGTPSSTGVTGQGGVIPALRATHPGAPHLASERWEGDASALGAPSSTGVAGQGGVFAPARTVLFSTAILFSLAALSKETAIVTPVALALWHIYLALRDRAQLRTHLAWAAALLFPVLPLAAWYAYHFHRTGFIFGNPEFLRYNATANLDARRIALCLYHRFLHLTMHMNMYVPVICAVAALLMPSPPNRARLPRRVLSAIAVILIANWIAFSILGGALLTRYLLPMFPLVLLVCVATWQRHLRAWPALAALSAAAFLAGIWINPPYAFAPEDNLTYRDFIVLHQRAIAIVAQRFPQATVLTAWPAVSELERPELGYTTRPIKAFPIENFSVGEIEKAAQEPGDYDTALIFSTKWAPPPGALDLSRLNRPPAPGSAPSSDARYFDFHEDVRPAEAAAILHGDVVWKQSIRGEWVAILRFPRIESAGLAVR